MYYTKAQLTARNCYLKGDLHEFFLLFWFSHVSNLWRTKNKAFELYDF